jgi:hypothetical protein
VVVEVVVVVAMVHQVDPVVVLLVPLQAVQEQVVQLLNPAYQILPVPPDMATLVGGQHLVAPITVAVAAEQEQQDLLVRVPPPAQAAPVASLL